MIDKLNIGQKFIITYRPNTHNGEARPKLKNGKDTRQITRRAQWTDKSRVVMQTKYLPVPVYVKVMYSLKIRTEYVQQMNDILF